MEPQEQIRTLQLTYAAQLADAAGQYARAGILEQVTAERRAARMAQGSEAAARMGITTASEAFTRPAEIFGCARWQVHDTGDGIVATSQGCLLHTLAGKLGAPTPCRLFCLDPIEAMIGGLDAEAHFSVEETLPEGAACRVRVGRASAARD